MWRLNEELGTPREKPEWPANTSGTQVGTRLKRSYDRDDAHRTERVATTGSADAARSRPVAAVAAMCCGKLVGWAILADSGSFQAFTTCRTGSVIMGSGLWAEHSILFRQITHTAPFHEVAEFGEDQDPAKHLLGRAEGTFIDQRGDDGQLLAGFCISVLPD